jgi:hypothetical protein
LEEDGVNSLAAATFNVGDTVIVRLSQNTKAYTTAANWRVIAMYLESA